MSEPFYDLDKKCWVIDNDCICTVVIGINADGEEMLEIVRMKSDECG